jgi:hypothetical protein
MLFRPLNPPILGDFENPVPPKWGAWGLTGVGFLQLGGVRVVKSINRGRRKRTPAMKTNRNVIQEISNQGK